MVTLDNLVVTTALPVIRARPARVDLAARVDGERVHAHLRRAAPDRRRARRPLRPAADVRRSGSASSPSRRPRPRSRRSIDALDVARARAGRRRRDRDAADADDPLRGGPARSSAGSRSAPGAGSAASRSRSARSSAAPSSSGISWHWIFWLNVPIGLVLVAARAGAGSTRRTARTARSTCPASRSPASACSASSGASCAATRSAGARRRSSARSSPASLLVAAFVALGAARAGADAADALLPRPHVRARERRVALHVLRDVRLDLPARAVLPDRAGLLAARSPGCGSCRGRRCRCSSRRSPARSPTGSAASG